MDISFYGGFIEKIQVQGKINHESTVVTFNNKFSIGISSSRDIQRLNDISLCSDEKFSGEEIEGFINHSPKNIKSNFKDTLTLKYIAKGYQLRIKVGNVIRYLKKVDINANDISPAQTVIQLNAGKKESHLFREESSKLFETKIYSDLLGLVEEENPNGIIQIEVEKRFIINTIRKPVYIKYKDNQLFDNRIGYGLMQYIDAIFTYSKIESDNKYLSPIIPAEVEGSLTPYYSLISIYQNRNYSVGGAINLGYIENQDWKLNISLDAGLLYGRTGLINDQKDPKEYYANNLEIPLALRFDIIPEGRIKMSFTEKISYFKVFDPTITIRNPENNETKFCNHLLYTSEFGLELNISETGKLFFRYRFIREWANWENNFSQIQLGYSFYILKSNKL